MHKFLFSLRYIDWLRQTKPLVESVRLSGVVKIQERHKNESLQSHCSTHTPVQCQILHSIPASLKESYVLPPMMLLRYSESATSFRTTRFPGQPEPQAMMPCCKRPTFNGQVTWQGRGQSAFLGSAHRKVPIMIWWFSR